MRIFVGYDSRERLSYHVLSHSIARRASVPTSIQPVMLSQLAGCYHRERGPTESTEFSISRFLVPWLSGYQGWSLFMDCDMLCLADVAELWKLIYEQQDKAVLVCKHDYVPKGMSKFLGHVQTKYPRKNWSSFMLMNNDRCRALTPESVSAMSGLDLHRFNWLEDSEVGEVPLEWNWLVGEYAPNPAAKVLHYTLGGPWFPDTPLCDAWSDELTHMLCGQ